jgi:hypothetical protein
LHGVVDSVNGMKNIVLGIDLDGIPPSDAPLKRSLSIMISKKSLKPHLTRSTSTRSSNGEYICVSWLLLTKDLQHFSLILFLNGSKCYLEYLISTVMAMDWSNNICFLAEAKIILLATTYQTSTETHQV